MVVGHTIQQDGINAACGDQVGLTAHRAQRGPAPRPALPCVWQHTVTGASVSGVSAARVELLLA